MKKYAVTTTALILLLFWPTMAQDFSGSPQGLAPERIHSQFEETYLKELTKRGRSLDSQGLYVESLDGSFVLADHQSNTAFNPASVIKIATSFAALSPLNPRATTTASSSMQSAKHQEERIKDKGGRMN